MKQRLLGSRDCKQPFSSQLAACDRSMTDQKLAFSVCKILDTSEPIRMAEDHMAVTHLSI